MGAPFISVVIPTYNSGKYIAETLKTVFSQTYVDYEIVVSDDGSCDNTREIVKTEFNKFSNKKTTLLLNNHEGPSAARNNGINSSKGQWISFLDSDDKWFPEKLKHVTDYISGHNDVGLVCHNEIWKHGETDTELKYNNMFDDQISHFLSLYRQNSLSTSAVTVKKELLIKAGLFDSHLLAAQDYDLWLRLALLDNMKFGFIDHPLGLYITREGNISSHPVKRLQCLLQINKKICKDLNKVVVFPLLEKQKFKGRVYGSAGLDLIATKSLKKGIFLIVISLIKWPFRFDWLRKFLKV